MYHGLYVGANILRSSKHGNHTDGDFNQLPQTSEERVFLRRLGRKICSLAYFEKAVWEN